MGEVYRATDTTLKRQVAIKILPVSAAPDAERLARFQREAGVLATLNHPHIAAMDGIEESHDVRALVMELVEGEELSARIACGPIAMDDVLTHRGGARSRPRTGDRPPRSETGEHQERGYGVVKVLDLSGLAKLAQPEAVGGRELCYRAPKGP
jgi:hypothetical protein